MMVNGLRGYPQKSTLTVSQLASGVLAMPCAILGKSG
jgi:hypothetical protein